MRRLYEHTDAELVELDEDAVTNLINCECAHEGAPLAGLASPAPPVKPEVAPDATCYRVDCDTLRFATVEEANHVAEFIAGTTQLATVPVGKDTWGGPYQLAPADRTPTVVIERHWTGEHYRKHKDELERYEEHHKNYKAELEKFSRACEEHDAVKSSVTRRVEGAKNKHQQCVLLKAQFEEYCALADGNRELALTFLLKATPHEESFMRTTLNMEESTYDKEEQIDEV